MVCQACGGPVGTEVRFCPNCGTQVGTQAGAQAGGQEVNRPASPPPGYPSPGYPPPGYPATGYAATGYAATGHATPGYAAPGYPPPANPIYPAYPGALGRVRRNLQILGVLWLVYAGMRMFSGLAGMFFLSVFSRHGFGRGWPMNPMGPVWMGHLVPFIGAITILATILSLAVGYGLLTRKPWGRTLAIVAGVLSLFKFPLGTALGIYTLVVLAPSEAQAEYDSIVYRG